MPVNISGKPAEEVIELLNRINCTKHDYLITADLLGIPGFPREEIPGINFDYQVVAFYCRKCGLLKLYDAKRLGELMDQGI